MALDGNGQLASLLCFFVFLFSVKILIFEPLMSKFMLFLQFFLFTLILFVCWNPSSCVALAGLEYYIDLAGLRSVVNLPPLPPESCDYEGRYAWLQLTLSSLICTKFYFVFTFMIQGRKPDAHQAGCWELGAE